ncbi:MAG: hypothetical protein BMS9Abin29_1259 [Gemmatimonadota bacterium]|nr:MAG: hypothetical protein BMS9Abin29_1259 [Gemmatimonadota bacterium]
MLRLRLLGTLALEDANGRTVLANSKPGLLLAVLAATDGQRAPRGHLADLIWPGKNRERARASLRQAIHHLAKLSPELPLDADKQDVWLDPSRVSVDLWDFDTAIAERRLEDALAVYGGPFLGSGVVGVGRELHHWIEAYNDRIAIAVQVAYPTLVEALLGEGRDGAAVEYARAYAHLNALNEHAQITLVKSLLSTGDALGGLQVYQAFRAQLAEDEGDEPSEEFQALIREVPHGVVGRPAAVAAASSVGLPNGGPASTAGGHGSRAGLRSMVAGRGGWVSAGAVALGVAGVAIASLQPWPDYTLSDRVLLTGVLLQDGSSDAVDLRITRRGVEWVTRVRGGVDAVRSPDGTRFATTASGPHGTDITIVTDDGSRQPAVSDKADERSASWSPDGRFLLFSFGKLAEYGSYELGAGIWDSETGTRSIIEGLVPVGLTQRLDWSPDGSRIAAITRGPDGSDLLTIVTPAGVIVSSETLGEGRHQDPEWSPDGEWIAYLSWMDGRSSISMIRPDGTDERVVVAAIPQPRSGPSWITSGHIAYLEGFGDEHRLMITTVEPPSTTYGYSAPHLISMRGVPAPVSIDLEVLNEYLRRTAETVFRGLVPTWVDTIALTTVDGPVSPGQWIHVKAVTLDEDGYAVSALAPVEWAVSDTSLIWSDGRGLFRLMGEGRATITASLGGWRTSDIEVRSTASPRRDRRRWLVEDWTGGLDASKWATFGEPSPIVRRTGGPDGNGVFLNNGDENYTSGVVSRRKFPTAAGISVDAWGQAPFSGRVFEAWMMAFSRTNPLDDGSADWDHENPSQGPASIRLVGAEEEMWVGPAPHAPPMPTETGEWRLYTLQLDASGLVTVLIDGEVYFRWRSTDPPQPGDSVYVALFGSSLNAEILHGPVTVYEGLRYEW